MFQERVVAHYEARGYRVHEGARLRGSSGQIYACDLVVQGPLGNLVVSFAEDGDAAEVGYVRRVARDVGATPVLAAAVLDNQVHGMALRSGVAVLDEPALRQAEAERPTGQEALEALPALETVSEEEVQVARAGQTLWTKRRHREAAQAGASAPADPSPGHAGDASRSTRSGIWRKTRRPVAQVDAADHDAAEPTQVSAGPDTGPVTSDDVTPTRDTSRPAWLSSLGAPKKARAWVVDPQQVQPPIEPVEPMRRTGPVELKVRAPGHEKPAKTEAKPPQQPVAQAHATEGLEEDASQSVDRPVASETKLRARTKKPSRTGADGKGFLDLQRVAQAAVGGAVAGLLVFGAAFFFL